MAQLMITSDPYLKFRSDVLRRMPRTLVSPEELIEEINVKLRQYRAKISYRSFNVIFDREEDLTLFLLRWS